MRDLWSRLWDISLSCNNSKQVFHTYVVFVTKQYNVILAKRQLCCAAWKLMTYLVKAITGVGLENFNFNARI